MFGDLWKPEFDIKKKKLRIIGVVKWSSSESRNALLIQNFWRFHSTFVNMIVLKSYFDRTHEEEREQNWKERKPKEN
jgi:hypothetical protein